MAKRTFVLTRFVPENGGTTLDEQFWCTVDANTPSQAARKVTNHLCKQLYGERSCTVELALTEKAPKGKEYRYRAIRELDEHTVGRGPNSVNFRFRARVYAIRNA